jgi:hypothetical protein
MIQEEIKCLAITFTPEEVQTLLTLGQTSHQNRVDFLKSKHSVTIEQANSCSNILAEIYFAARSFRNENSL